MRHVFGALELDVLRLLILAQALKRRMPQQPVGRPVGEHYLRDEFGLHPDRLLAGRGIAVDVREGAFLDLPRHETFSQVVERLLIEAGSDLSGVDQLA